MKSYEFDLDLSGEEPLFKMEGKEYKLSQVAVAINAYEKKKATIYNGRNKKKKVKET